ncbi:MAG: hypothetical protein JW902_15395 [Syntrophaceae bacterium]|nr:hypothetical protein [Syntrophaceae bacterium]
MDIEILRAFFGWCTIINGGLLIFAFLICATAGDWVYRMHSRWFRIPRETLDRTLYCFLGAMKIIVITLNLVPYVVLVIIG